MRSYNIKASFNAGVLAAAVLCAPGLALAQTASTVNLTASQQSTILPDGNTVPMWGWTCGSGAAAATNASCTALTYSTGGTLNAQTGGAVWQPPLIVIPYSPSGNNLTINLTNTLPVETSIMIIGQAGGGLGATTSGTGPGGAAGPVREAGPRTDGDHQTQTETSWTIVASGSFTPPAQGSRVRSMVPEVAGVATVGATAATGSYTWNGLKPGTYLIRTGTYPSIQGPMGLYGVLVVTQAPTSSAAGLAYPVTSTPGVTYDIDVVALESELDARQNNMVAALFPTGSLPAGASTANTGFSETAKWTPQCGAGANGLTPTGGLPTCYPPAVDYTPLYFLMNGISFSKDAQQLSALPVPAAPAAGAANATGNVLVRFVNAGSHMHVPSVNNLKALLVAEDANVLPDVALALKSKTLFATNSNQTAPATAASGLQLRTEVFQPAGKVMDVLVSPSASSGTYATGTYLIFDRSLSGLSADNTRDGGMQAVLDVADSGATTLSASNAVASLAGLSGGNVSYQYSPGVTLSVSDPGKGVLARATNVSGVQLVSAATSGNGTLTLNPNGTFTYVPTGSGTDVFTFCANGTVTGAVCSSGLTATITFSVSATAGTVCTTAGQAGCPTANPDSYAGSVASLLRVGAPGVLGNDVDPSGYPMSAVFGGSCAAPAGASALTAAATGNQAAGTVSLGSDGSFSAKVSGAGTYYFCYQAKNSQNSLSNPAAVTLTFPAGSGLSVTVFDAVTGAPINDFKWLIEQDLTPYVDPACQVNVNTKGGAPTPTGSNGQPCLLGTPAGTPFTLATVFHSSFMPVVAEGCTGPQSCEKGQTVYDPASGTHIEAACDGYGICTIGASQLPASTPDQALLPATDSMGRPARYYLSILSGDAQNAFAFGNTSDPTIAGNCTPASGQTEATGITEASTCGHTMGGAPIPACMASGGICTYAPVVVKLQPQPLKTATVTAWVFEDDFPLNGEPDTGGGVDVVAPQEHGLGNFQIEIWDTAGGVGDNTGQMTYDMFNMPLTNALNGTIDPATGFDACPIAPTATDANGNRVAAGQIIVCPTYESDGKTLSPLAGQVVVRNLMQGKFTLIAHPGAVREANGEEWVQTNSLDGGHFLDSFLKSGEPAYFQEYGPGGFHVFFGMANPKIINSRLTAICAPSRNNPPPAGTPYAAPCRNVIHGQVTNLHQPRPPNESLSSSGVFPQGDPRNYAMFSYTQCFAALGDSDGATIAFAKCDPNGNFTFPDPVLSPNIKGVPDGNYGVVIFDNWNDFIVDGSMRPANVSGGQTVSIEFPTFTWQTHLWTKTYMDTGGLGAPMLDSSGNLDPVASPGLIQVPVRIRQVNGKPLNTLFTDITGQANFDETFPAFAWYSVESDTTRFRGTGVHVVNDAGGALDGASALGGNGQTTTPYQGVLNSIETFSLPTSLEVPGAIYCTVGDPQCAGSNLANATRPTPSCGTPNPDGSVNCSGLSTGRIDPGSVEMEGWQGGVSEFDMLDWGKVPYLPGENGGIRGHVVNATTRPFDDPRMLFQNLWEPLVPNVTINLYQEGTAPDGTMKLTLIDTTQTTSFDAWAQGSTNGVPNVNCPGQDPVNDPFYGYTLAGTQNYLYAGAPPNNSQFKCYEGYHNLNQVQPMPYDGLYEFPSQICLNNPGTPSNPAKPVTVNGVTFTCATIPNPAYGLAGASGAGAKAAVLPAGTYVTEVVLPPGWQLNKEEDLNLLIGDQYIASVAQQFTGLGAIFITPDQASIDSANLSYTGPYNASNPYSQPWSCAPNGGACTLNPISTNNGKESQNYGRTTFGNFGPGGLIQQSAPCVGLLRIVPDFLSIAPESGEVAPFAGSSRNLCDRREVTLNDQMQGNADFFIYTHTPKTGNFTGFVTDDFSSEFDPASPSYGEKFAVPNVPVSIKDFSGREISRLYTDQWGNYNGLVYSTWEVDPPNITGYSPNIMITCMNDPGPIRDNRVGSATYGQMITDPYYNPGYSDFCYENPFMPGDTQYLDTPVVPTQAFADGYNPPDCAYPDATPAIKSVVNAAAETNGTGTLAAGSGPWVSAGGTGHNLTITALGDQVVPDNAYSGPAANTSPYNLKTITRHYGFGSSAGTVTIGGQPATVVGTGWSDTSLTVQVPSGMPACRVQQQGNGGAQCGELVITAANGKQSIDTVTVTVGGKAPTYIAGESSTPNTFGSSAPNALQTAIDTATPGDLIIVGPGVYNEMLIMWKPVRLQGVGATSSVINANTFPAGLLLDPWRRQVNCLFGLALDGGAITSGHSYDSSGKYSCPAAMQLQTDRIPLEGIVGWDATVNGNLAELLQEPSLMGAYEGAGITVLAKGVRYPRGVDPFGTGAEAAFPAGTVLLTTSNRDCEVTGNYLCNPARIDGLSVTNSSQGGGGIFAHGWTHYLEIANDRVYNNGGTLSGGISVGQGESEEPIVVNGDAFDTAATAAGFSAPGYLDPTTAVPPRPVPRGTRDGTQVPYGYNMNVYVHHNAVTNNASYGDELGANTPASAGGVTFCTGADYYKFQYNFVCGNLSSGNGGGLAHFGFSYDGDIEYNQFVFNQSINPTLTTYGGGVIVLGAAPDAPSVVNGVIVNTECGSTNDIDCAPGLTEGTGPNLVINANLFQGNTAEEGSGGGLELQHVNGLDIERFPNSPGACGGDYTPDWFCVHVTNNVFANNVAGWTGGGASLHDTVVADFVNNTFVSNDATASAGVLFDSLGAPGGSQPPPGCDPVANPNCTGFAITTSNFLPAGLVTERHTANLVQAFQGNSNSNCPTGHSQCGAFSNPVLRSDLFWQNRTFHITVTGGPGATSAGPVFLSPQLSQTGTGMCPQSAVTGSPDPGPQYWDIGVYGDTGPSNHGSGLTLAPTYSLLDDPADYPGNNNLAGVNNGTITTQSCNGSRVPPEIAPLLCAGPNGFANAPGCIQPGTVGIQVPGGVPDTVPPPLPAFTLTPAATVDEGSNWINMFYGPLSLSNPTIQSGSGNAQYGVPLVNAAPVTGSPAIGAVPTSIPHPTTDFFGNARPDATDTAHFDVGAIEVTSAGGGACSVTVSPPSLAFGNQPDGSTSATQNVTITNGCNTNASGGTFTFGGGTPQPFARVNSGAFPAGAPNCTATLAVGASCTIKVDFAPPLASTSTPYSRTLTAAYSSGAPVQVTLTGTGTPVGTLSFTGASNGTLTTNLFGMRMLTFTIPSSPRATVTSVITVTNTGGAALGITAETLALNFSGLFSITAQNCTSLSPLAPNGTCTVSVQYATPATRPGFPNFALLDVANNGSGTVGGESILALSAQ